MKDPKSMSNYEKAKILRAYGKKTKESSTTPIVERVTRLILQQEPAELGTVWMADVAMKSDFLRFEWDSCEITKIPIGPEDTMLIERVRETVDQAGMCSVIDVLRPELTDDIVHSIFIGVGRGYPVFGCQLTDCYIKVRRVDDELPEYDADKDAAGDAVIDEIAKLFDSEYAQGKIPMSYFEDEKSGFEKFCEELGIGDIFKSSSSCCGDGDCEGCQCGEEPDGETDEPEVDEGATKGLPEGSEAETSSNSNLNPQGNKEDQE